MNTNTIRSPLAWPPTQTSSQTNGKTGSETFAATMRTAFLYSSRIVLADAPALAIIVTAAWAIGGEQSASVLQAFIWAAGFVFLALAAEGAQTKHFVRLLLTGLALPVLALLSYHVAVEFAVVGATLIAVG
ncbi:MAG: hypothetical protein EXR85_05795, partial [Xanthomonadales bacterium]|nr:hypothetical protein [Xanthomonadales bacterium]